VPVFAAMVGRAARWPSGATASMEPAMSGLGIQDAIALLIVLGAVAYLVRRRLRKRAAAACESCEGCAPPPPEDAGAGLVEIQRPQATRGSAGRLDR
jgi:hypothetical protein